MYACAQQLPLAAAGDGRARVARALGPPARDVRATRRQPHAAQLEVLARILYNHHLPTLHGLLPALRITPTDLITYIPYVIKFVT